MTASPANATCGYRQSLGSVAAPAALTGTTTTPVGRRMTKGRSMKRVVAGVIGLALGAAVLVGCSDDKKPEAAPSSPAAGNTQVSTSGSTEVKVDGSDLSGLDLN